MTRIEFFRSSGRWLILMLLVAAGGFLFASRRVSLRNYCAANAHCAGCGLNRVCGNPEDQKAKTDEKE